MRGNDDGSDCCDMRGMLGFLILYLLSKKPMHGQDLQMKYQIEKEISQVLELYIQH